MFLPHSCALIASFLLCSSLAASSRPLLSPSLSPLPRFGVCQREGAKIVGTKPILPRHGSRAPKITRHVTPRYPDLPDDTTISGIWIGEVLVDVKGKVAQVWPIREPRLTPSFPPFNASIVTAIRQWEYEPLLVESRAVPWCMTVTVNIDLQ
jgi:hypothetical protein